MEASVAGYWGDVSMNVFFSAKRLDPENSRTIYTSMQMAGY